MFPLLSSIDKDNKQQIKTIILLYTVAFIISSNIAYMIRYLDISTR